MATAAAKVKVGFLGLGNMGGHMAKNLLKAGHAVAVYDPTEAAVERAVAAGATNAGSAVAAAKDVDFLVTMLPTTQSVIDTFDAVLGECKDGSLIIDCSTIDPIATQKLSAKAAGMGRRVIDAPVSGGVGGAEAGTLTFMVGGSDTDFEASKTVLQSMGANIVHCGGAGTGQVAKICNNLILGISMSGVSEAMNLGVKLGIDAKTLAGIVNTSTGRCWSSDTYNPCPGVIESAPASRGYTGGFGSALMLKDLKLAADAAAGVGTPIPVGTASLEAYGRICDEGYAGLDFSSMYRYVSENSRK